MRIDKRLNLVIPVDRDGGSKLYVHSTPITREVFEIHFEVLARTFSRITSVDFLSASRIAALMLKKVADQIGEGDAIEKGFWPEVHRKTVVLVPADNGGYETVPLDIAIRQKKIDSEEASEIDNSLAFFTLASWMLRSSMQAEVDGAVRMWGAQTSSLTSTEFIRSLKTSTKDETSGEMETTSSPES